MSNRWQRHRNQRYSHPELPGRQYQEAHGIAFQAKTGSVFLILGRCPKFFPSVRRQSRSPHSIALSGLTSETLVSN